MKITTIGECTAGHTDREHQAVSATAITGTGSMRQRRLRRGRPFGLGFDRCERRLNKFSGFSILFT